MFQIGDEDSAFLRFGGKQNCWMKVICLQTSQTNKCLCQHLSMNNYDAYNNVTNTEALKVKTDREKLALSFVFIWTNNNLCDWNTWWIHVSHDCGKLMLNGQVSLYAILNLLTLSFGNYLKCFVVENVPNRRWRFGIFAFWRKTKLLNESNLPSNKSNK